MSEKIYAWLLHLYPSRFREVYGDEALLLFRDRARDEKGFFPRLRLWLDLLADLAFSVLRQYRYVQPALIGASAQHHLDGVPSFQVLGGESPRPGALLFGGVLSLVTLGAFPVFISHVGNYQPPRAAVTQPQRPADARESALGDPAPQAANGADGETTASEQPGMAATTSVSGNATPNDSQSTPVLALGASGRSQDVKLDAAERRRVIAGAIANLKKYYVDPDIAQKTADSLLAHEKNGDEDAATNGAAFAELLTRQMNDVSHDQQLIMIYQTVKTLDRQGPTPEEIAQYRREMKRSNCRFEKVEILPHNIGYLKLNAFPDLSLCQAKAAAVMASLNNADAIIFDLRDNRGGSADMVALLATYLFDRPTHLNDFYDRGANSTEESWTLPAVPGNKLSDKPAYVLTSATSFSAAEGFSYDLKMLKRATLVGETTSGRSHMGMAHRIDDHFLIRVPGIRVINPISKTNWEGRGVEPDVKVKAADALTTAEKLAESKLRKR
jgi:hypothetical protein